MLLCEITLIDSFINPPPSQHQVKSVDFAVCWPTCDQTSTHPNVCTASEDVKKPVSLLRASLGSVLANGLGVLKLTL